MNTEKDERRGKLAAIHIAKKWAVDKGFFADDADYQAFLQKAAGVQSSGKAGPSQLDEILRAFKRLGWVPVKKKRTYKTQTGRLIAALWHKHSREKTDDALLLFIRNRLDLPENVTKGPDQLIKEEADIVLGAIRGMVKSKRKATVKKGMPK